MNIQLKTRLRGHYLDIMTGFDRQLFEYLTPPSTSIDILEFTGSKQGDRYHLLFRRPVRTEWIGEITEDGHNENEAWFVDEGTKLPFPLKYWHHKHIVRRISDTESMIIDDMTFRGRNWLFSVLLYPAIYIGFWPRKKLYKRYFADKISGG